MTHRIIFTIVVILFSLLRLSGQGNAYNIKNIPAEIMEEAGSVIRYSKTELDIKSPSEAVLSNHMVITILHHSHRNNALVLVPYEAHERISDLNIYVYDANGNLIEKIGKADIHDISNVTGSTLFSDSRRKLHEPEIHPLPYTLEYRYKKHFKGILYYPPYFPLFDYNQAVQTGLFSVEVASGLNWRYLQHNITTEPVVTKNGDKTLYTWEFSNVKPIKQEALDWPFIDLAPAIWSAPGSFSMQGYDGDMSSWEQFGNWIYRLNADRASLPEQTLIEVHALTDTITDTIDKIKCVYNYMQNKTRYVSVDIGIGGWQPFPAQEVDKNAYGDCKALSNYTHALLKAIGIRSYYTLVSAGQNPRRFFEDFPSQQFNHVILCIPLHNDTVWLETTNQRQPFNYLGSFTDDRLALVVKEHGSKLVRTPSFNTTNSSRTRTANIMIDKAGSSTATVKNIYTGEYYDEMRSIFYYEGKNRMDKVRDGIRMNSFKLKEETYTLVENPPGSPKLVEKYSIESKHATKKIGDNFIMDLNVFNDQVEIPPMENSQKSEILFRRSSITIDTLNFIIPSELKVSQLPQNKSINSPFGTCVYSYELIGDTLRYIRSKTNNKGLFPNSDYLSIRDYLKDINQTDNRKIILSPKI